MPTSPQSHGEPTEPGEHGADAPRSPREQKRLVWNRRFGLALGVLGAFAVSALLLTSVLAPAGGPGQSVGPGGADAGDDGAGDIDSTPIAGLETFANEPSHVETPVTYPQTPPAGGPHSPVWLNCGVYSEPVPNENAVHSLEHGAVWATYDPALDPDELAVLVAALPGDRVIVSPYSGLDSPIVLSAWNVQLPLTSASDPRILAFADAYRNGPTAPEAGESCSGALNGPGRVD